MLIKSEIGLWVVGPRRDSSTDWGCRQNGEPITQKHALNRRNSRKMTPPLNRRKPRCTARFTERRVHGALCTQTRRFQAVRASYVSPCRNLVEIRGPRPSQRPWPDLVKTPQTSKLRLYSRVVVCEIRKIEVYYIDFSRPSPESKSGRGIHQNNRFGSGSMSPFREIAVLTPHSQNRQPAYRARKRHSTARLLRVGLTPQKAYSE
jgi:hypothetical protein